MVYIEFVQGKLDVTTQYIHNRDVECCQRRMTFSLMATSLLWLPSWSAHSLPAGERGGQGEGALSSFPFGEAENVAAAGVVNYDASAPLSLKVALIGSKVCISRVHGIVAAGFGVHLDKGFLYYRVLKGSLFKHEKAQARYTNVCSSDSLRSA